MPPANRRREAGVGGHGGFRLGYRPELDGLRGLAVLAVMAYHCDLRRVVPGGFLGVDLFFVLSGFLITALLMREHQQTGRVHLPRFYLRRALRLLPALFVMLAVCCVWAALRTKPDRAAVIYQAALLTACHAANGAACWSVPMDLLSHAWSLSLEEQFYVAWPAPPRPAAAVRRDSSADRLAGRDGDRRFGAGPRGVMAQPLAGRRAGGDDEPDRPRGFAAGGLPRRPPRLRRPTTAVARLAPHFAARRRAISAIFLRLARNHRARNGSPFLVLGGYTAVAAAVAVVIAALASSPPPAGVAASWAPPPLALDGAHLLRALPVALSAVVADPQADPRPHPRDPPPARPGRAARLRPRLRSRRRFVLGRGTAVPPLEGPAGGDVGFSLISARSGRRSGPGTLAASSARAGCPA